MMPVTRITPFRMIAAILILVPVVHYANPLLNEEMLRLLKSEYSEEAYQRGVEVNRLIEAVRDLDTMTRLTRINGFFNRFGYREDAIHWGRQDYWATPIEFIGTRFGDCEDYVIAKYFALRKAGVPDSQLYLTYAKALRQNVAHMVLSYFETPTSEPLILDNYDPRIVRASQRPDLLPIYSFNAESLFLNNASAGLGRSLPSQSIKNSKWEKLLRDLREPLQ